MLIRHAVLAFLTLFLVHAVHADDVSPSCNPEVTTLRLYFAPEIVASGRSADSFKPQVAKLYVDNLYVGDAIVNLYGYSPTLRFRRSTPTIRVEMSGNRKFETQMTFLGNGSTQLLFVDFSKIGPKTTGTVVRGDASADPFSN
ncbi:hypothetical protein N9N28_01655 [Rubripirellula amarantea]|nr:hypothetical protein [Rubripirellula amarantea]